MDEEDPEERMKKYLKSVESAQDEEPKTLEEKIIRLERRITNLENWRHNHLGRHEKDERK